MAGYDYYKLLGLRPDASQEEVETAFRRVAARYHPQRNPKPEAAQRYELLEAAYQVLSDPERRAKHDKLLQQYTTAIARPVRQAPARPKARRLPSARPTPPRPRARHAERPRTTRILARVAQHVLSWGASAAIHALALLILARWHFLTQPIETPYPDIVIDFKEPPPEPPKIDISTQVNPQPPAIELKPQEVDLEEIVDKPALAELDRYAKSQVMAVQGPFGGRRPGGREAAVKTGGPTDASENAVNLGLLWLAVSQADTGGWHTDNMAARWADPGVSGLAVLAFLGAGNTHREGRYRYNVARALAYLKQEQDTEGAIGRTGREKAGHMYCHAICTLALVEAYAMTKDPLLREPAERAVDFICRTQNRTGGWRYYYNSADGDSSVSGWMVMALRSARLAGIVVPDKAFEGAREFFDAVTNKEEGWTAYMRGLPPSSVALIAVGLLCNQYLGLEQDDPYIARASALINKFPPKWIEFGKRDRITIDNLPATKPGANDYYYWYYANLALHQRRSDEWEKWHPQVRELLIKRQVKEGKDQGSWPPISRWSLRGGRVYATAMAILTLEVYYRYAPIYREVVDEMLAAYGAALDAFNRFVRVADRADAHAAQIRQEAVEKITAYLQLSEPKPDAKPDTATGKRREQAVSRLIDLYRVAKDYPKTIEILAALPQRFPGVLPEPKRKRLLADCYLALSRELARAGKTSEAKAAEDAALPLLEELVANTPPGQDTKLRLWAAERLFQREHWESALELFLGEGTRLYEHKAPDHELAAYVYRRIVQCSAKLTRYPLASLWLARLKDIVGPSLAILCEEADLERQRGRYTHARRLYDSILPRVQKLGPEWWQARADSLEMALYEGQSQYVAKEIDRLQVLYPDLGSPETRRRLLLLLRRAEQAARG